MSFESDQYLEHYGVAGMKWGRRKTPVDRGEARVQRAQAHRDAGARRVAKYATRGKSKAVVAALGKNLAVGIVAGTGGMALSKIPGGPAYKAGVANVTQLFGFALNVKTAIDIHGIVVSDKPVKRT